MEDNISKEAVYLSEVDNATLLKFINKFFEVDIDFIQEISYRLERGNKAHVVLAELNDILSDFEQRGNWKDIETWDIEAEYEPSQTEYALIRIAQVVRAWIES